MSARGWYATLRGVLVIRATKKVLDRLPGAKRCDDHVESTTRLGDWYLNVLFWKPQVALFVSETTLLPVLTPFAPAVTLLERFPATLATHLDAHAAPRGFVEVELAEMQERRVAKTANRSVVGVMNEFGFLAGVFAERDGRGNLLALSMRLAETPCGPLYRRHISPDRELDALIHGTPPLER